MAVPPHGQSGEWVTAHLPGIFQGLMAATLGGGLLPAVQIGWQRVFHHALPSPADGTLASAVVALVLIPAFWLLAKPLSRLAAHRLLGKTPDIKGDRLSIYVAHFGDDELSAATRDRVIASIRAELGPERVEILPAGILLRLTEGVSDDVAADATRKKARALLKKKHGDLLIWGKVYSILGERAKIDLRFVSAEYDRSRAELFGFTDKLMLEADFGPEMGAALAAVASTMAIPAIRDSGKYVVRTLVPVAKRLARLTRDIPASVRPEDRGMLLHSYALIQFAIGEQSGEPEHLEEAVAAYREALRERTRERVPLDWAVTQNDFGNTLASLGEREGGTEKLEEAVAAYREALRERTRERVPLDWAMTQNNLENALSSLGERESGTARLEEAVAAYREALRERTRERVPLDWAATQNNLGVALMRLGERESGTVRLEEAVAAYRDALREWTRERVPLQWAITQNNLGVALMRLGERESGTVRLEEAVVAYREALRERTRERVPLDWATTQNNLGMALTSLGERESGTARLEEAVAASREALWERTRERVPLDWAMTQNNLGNALSSLGERESGTARLKEAVAAYREALREGTRERAPLQWATTQNNLGIALRRLGERESGTEKLEEALAAYRDALGEYTRERVPLDWAMTQNNLGNALSSLGERESGTARLKEAVAAYHEALQEFTVDRGWSPLFSSPRDRFTSPAHADPEHDVVGQAGPCQFDSRLHHAAQ
ncbi:MAG: tetratricopeptide repeat protein [Bryobacteraceae bacterium]